MTNGAATAAALNANSPCGASPGNRNATETEIVTWSN